MGGGRKNQRSTVGRELHVVHVDCGPRGVLLAIDHCVAGPKRFEPFGGIGEFAALDHDARGQILQRLRIERPIEGDVHLLRRLRPNHRQAPVHCGSA